jgi:hypothetical protein
MEISDREPSVIRSRRYEIKWQQYHTVTWQAQPCLSAFPAALRARAPRLSDVHLFAVDRSTGPQRARPPRTDAVSVASGVPGVRIVGDDRDFRRWTDAACAYLDEIVAVETVLGEHWAVDERRIASSWRGRKEFARWQELVEEQFDRLVAASDRYRPVAEEVGAATAETERVYGEWAQRLHVLHDWHRSLRWRLVRTGRRSYRIERDDFAHRRPAFVPKRSDGNGYLAEPGSARGELDDVHQRAYHERRANLCRIEWGQPSVEACDRELAALLPDNGPIGRTGDGQPMVGPLPTTFAGWYALWSGRPLDDLSDTSKLRQDRLRQRKIERESRQRHGTQTSSRSGFTGGSWPTSLGAGGISCGAGHSGGFSCGSF